MLNLNKFCSLFIGLILSVVCALPLSARDINVRGTVTNIEGEPLFRVSIYNAGTNKLIGSTNEDGKYLVKIDSEGELLFTSLGYEECKAAVRGELTVDVVLRHSAVALEEVVVSAKRITDNVVPEPTDIEVKGNYFHIRTRVKIPKELFSTNARMIIQPGVYNVTREQMAAILYQYARIQGKLDDSRADLSIFSDLDSLSAYAKEPMSWAVAQGLFSGVSADTLAPGGSTTRAQAAVILTAFSKAQG